MSEASSSVLLWCAGLLASVVSIIAFLLWGTGGAVTLFDMVMALCT